MKGKMKESTRAASERLSLEPDSGVIYEKIILVSEVDHPERRRPHRVYGCGTQIEYGVCDVHHELK
jgi:hypothetical protein